jgi:hypothetical protein
MVYGKELVEAKAERLREGQGAQKAEGSGAGVLALSTFF